MSYECSRCHSIFDDDMVGGLNEIVNQVWDGYDTIPLISVDATCVICVMEKQFIEHIKEIFILLKEKLKWE